MHTHTLLTLTTITLLTGCINPQPTNNHPPEGVTLTLLDFTNPSAFKIQATNTAYDTLTLSAADFRLLDHTRTVITRLSNVPDFPSTRLNRGETATGWLFHTPADERGPYTLTLTLGTTHAGTLTFTSKGTPLETPPTTTTAWFRALPRTHFHAGEAVTLSGEITIGSDTPETACIKLGNHNHHCDPITAGPGDTQKFRAPVHLPPGPYTFTLLNATIPLTITEQAPLGTWITRGSLSLYLNRTDDPGHFTWRLKAKGTLPATIQLDLAGNTRALTFTQTNNTFNITDAGPHHNAIITASPLPIDPRTAHAYTWRTPPK